MKPRRAQFMCPFLIVQMEPAPYHCVLLLEGETHISAAKQHSQSHQTRAQFWKSVPMSSRIIMLVGVFTLFASMGFVQLLITPAKVTFLSTLVMICIYGLFAIGYALLSTLRKFRWLPVWGFIHACAFLGLSRILSSGDHSRQKRSSETELYARILGHCRDRCILR